MTEFEAATHQLLGVLIEALDPVVGYNHESDIRIGTVLSRLDGLRAGLVIDQRYPTVADTPARVRTVADRIRERIRVRLAEHARRVEEAVR